MATTSLPGSAAGTSCAAGKDRIEGGGGSDLMFGGPGKDALYGYDGVHDHLIGGLGADPARGDRLLDLVRAEARA